MLVMKRFINTVVLKHQAFGYNHRAALVSRLPKKLRSIESITLWFERNYPYLCIPLERIYLTYNTADLEKISREINYYEWVRNHCHANTLYTTFRCCGCCDCIEPCILKTFKANEIYEETLSYLKKQLQKYKEREREPLDTAFVVFAEPIADRINKFEKFDITRTKEFQISHAPAFEGK